MVAIPMVMAGCGEADAEDRGRVSTEQEEEIPEEKTEEVTEEVTQEEVTEPEEPVVEEAEETEAYDEYKEVYEPVFSVIEDVLVNGYDYDKDYPLFPMGLTEKVMYEDPEVLMRTIGYVLTDLNGDDVPELLIGENVFQTAGEVSMFYGGYSIVDDAPYCFLDGYARSSYEWLGDGKFLYYGSNSAMSSMYGQCYLGPDGTEFLWDDFYFSEEINGSSSYFHNTSGITDIDQSEKMDISGMDFWNKMDEFPLAKLSFKPLDFAAQVSIPNDEIGGRWYLRSYVDQKVIGYQFFSDGTWLAFTTSDTNQMPEEKLLSGRWEKNGEEYTLYDNQGDLIKTGKIVTTEEGDTALEFESITFYKADDRSETDETLADYMATWLAPNGSGLELAADGSWTLYNDEGNWVFGGHWVMCDGPYPVQVRLHSEVGDAGNKKIADAVLDKDESGFAIVELTVDPNASVLMDDYMSTGTILYKAQ